MKRTSLLILIFAVISSAYAVSADEWDDYYDYGDGYSEDYYSDDYDNTYQSDYGNYGGYEDYNDYNNYSNYGDYNSNTVPQENIYETPTLPKAQESVPAKPSNYKAVKTVKENLNITKKTIKSTADNEIAVYHSGGKLLLDNVKVMRDGKLTKGKAYSKYYGLGSAVLTSNGNTIVKNSDIIALGEYGCGIFSAGKGKTFVGNTNVTSKKESYALGIFSGKMYGYKLNISSENTALTCSKNGETVLDGGKLSNSKGELIELSASSALNNFNLTAKNSAVSNQNGSSSLSVFNSEVKSAGNYAFEINSGDKQSKLNIVNSDVKNSKGGLFTVNSSKAHIAISGLKIDLKKQSLLKCTGASECTFIADSQKINGNIKYDSSTKVNIYLQNKTFFTGKTELSGDINNSQKSTMYIENGSDWVVTGNSYVGILYNKGKIRDKKGNVVPIKAIDGTQYAQGKSKYTVTVENYFEKNPEKGYPKIDSWKKYSRKAPSELGIKAVKDNNESESVSDSNDGKIENISGKDNIFSIEIIYTALAILGCVLVAIFLYAMIKRIKKSQQQ